MAGGDESGLTQQVAADMPSNVQIALQPLLLTENGERPDQEQFSWEMTPLKAHLIHSLSLCPILTHSIQIRQKPDLFPFLLRSMACVGYNNILLCNTNASTAANFHGL